MKTSTSIILSILLIFIRIQAFGQINLGDYVGIAAGGGASFSLNESTSSLHVPNWGSPIQMTNGYLMFVEANLSTRTSPGGVDLFIGYQLNDFRKQITE